MKQYGVTPLALFGSTVREGVRRDSDVNILVYFAGPANFYGNFVVQFYLEDLIGCPVDW